MHYICFLSFVMLLSCKSVNYSHPELTSGEPSTNTTFDPSIPSANANLSDYLKEAESSKARIDEATNTAFSGGSGGETGKVVDGLKFEHNALASQYRVWAPASNDKNNGHALVVYLHGDTGSNFGAPELDPRISPQFAAYGQARSTLDQAVYEGSNDSKRWSETIVASILTPTYNGSFLTWSTGLDATTLDKHAAYVHELIQNKILTQYNVDLNQVYFVGQSGGAYFLSSSFIPQYAFHYKGGALMLCGGEPARDSLQVQQTSNLQKSFKLHFETTNNERPEITADIIQAKDFYATALGDKAYVKHVSKGSGGHCLFDSKSQPKIIDQVITAMQAASAVGTAD